MAELYGTEVLVMSGEELNYETYVGLYVNRHREVIRRSLPYAISAGLAFSGGKVPKQYFEALTDSDWEAQIARAANKHAQKEVDLTLGEHGYGSNPGTNQRPVNKD